jgi:hypothetical protein
LPGRVAVADQEFAAWIAHRRGAVTISPTDETECHYLEDMEEKIEHFLDDDVARL